jgi:hypothetical protein
VLATQYRRRGQPSKRPRRRVRAAVLFASKTVPSSDEPEKRGACLTDRRRERTTAQMRTGAMYVAGRQSAWAYQFADGGSAN